MGDKTGITWTDASWNPTTGCDRVSSGCDHCYAMTLAPRLKAMGAANYQTDGNPATSGPGFGIAEHPDMLDKPIRWTKPRMIFVNSMSDLFHDGVTDEFIARVFAVMALTPRHTYQVLTKRHARMRALLSSHAFRALVMDRFDNDDDLLVARARAERDGQVPAWPLPNVWLGVSAEDQRWADIRIPALLATPAAVRFVSAEPMLGPIDLSRYLDPERDCRCGVPAMEGAGQHAARCPCLTQPEVAWVIVGGESGKGHRLLDPEWVRGVRDDCDPAGVAFFFKQWGGATSKAGGHLLDGEVRQAFPASRAYEPTRDDVEWARR